MATVKSQGKLIQEQYSDWRVRYLAERDKYHGPMLGGGVGAATSALTAARRMLTEYEAILAAVEHETERLRLAAAEYVIGSNNYIAAKNAEQREHVMRHYLETNENGKGCDYRKMRMNRDEVLLEVNRQRTEIECLRDERRYWEGIMQERSEP